MEFDFADLKPSVLNWFISGIMAVTFILAMKFLTARYNIPYLSETFAAI
jgi:hypothetical protein